MRLFVFAAIVAVQLVYAASFDAVWNAASERCYAGCPGSELRPSAYGALTNPRMEFFGPEVTLLYHVPFPELKGEVVREPCWKWKPHTHCYRNPWGNITVLRNGGVPQAANLTEHVFGVEAVVEQAVPNANYSGRIVVDWEAWRIPFALNTDKFSVYNEYSKRLVAAAHPDWNEKQVDAEAEAQFNAGGKAIFLATVQTMKRMRPNASVGFYAYPYTEAQVEELTWFWDAVDLAMPSAYVRSAVQGAPFLVKYVAEATARGNAVRAAHPHVRSMAYVLNGAFLGEPPVAFTPAATAASIVTPALMGADGLFLWGSSETTDTCAGCAALSDAWHGIVGSALQRCVAAVATCAKTRCGGVGRCAVVGPINATAAVAEGCGLLAEPHPVTCV